MSRWSSRLTDRQALVLRKVQHRGPIRVHEIAVAVGLSDAAARVTLRQLVARGLVYHAASYGRSARSPRAWSATSIADRLYPLREARP